VLLYGDLKVPDLRQSLFIAKDWIRDCFECHSSCGLPNDMPHTFVPTRLLDVGSLKDDFGKVRIVAELPHQNCKYMTLSHRWGSASFLRLEAGNIERFMKGVAMSELSNTFQDAITVTRRMGVQYLWIDALCIIQGPTLEDWSFEAGRMCDVYTHSWYNIAALWAEDPHQGFLHHPRSETSFCTQVTVGDEELVIFNQKVWFDEVDNAPLNQRAWVLQERALAPRQLYFAKSHVFWQCPEKTSIDIFHQCFPPHLSMEQSLFRRYAGSWESSKSEDKPFGWSEYVMMYSGCRLTRPEDRLIAIAGLAQDIHRRNPDDQYLAGIWRSDLLKRLVWTVAGFFEDNILYPSTVKKSEMLAVPPRSCDASYRSPSWSWAQTEGATVDLMYHFDEGMLSMCEYKGVCINPAVPDNPFGKIRDGQLTLAGLLLPCLHSIENGGHRMKVTTSKEDIHLHYNVSFDQDPLTSWNGNENCDRHLFLLPLYSEHRFSGEPIVEGLILVRWDATTDRSVQYARVGTFWTKDFETCREFGVVFEELDGENTPTDYTSDRTRCVAKFELVESIEEDGQEICRTKIVARHADKNRWEQIVLI
jgi:hypothetical protein